MSKELEVIRIGKQLEKAVNADTVDEEKAIDLLRALQDLPMTLDLLQKSHVGLSVSTLRKKCDGSDVAGVGKKLIKQWKKLLPAGSSPKSSERRSSNPSTPPPAVYTSSNGATRSTKTTPTNGEPLKVSIGNPSCDPQGSKVSSEPTTPISPIVPTFSTAIDCSRRMGGAGNDVRDRCRDLLYNAIKKGLPDVTIEDDTRLFNLAAMIEDSIFSELRKTDMKYKNRVRSRVSNLGDVKNPLLKHKVISGELTPSRIASMTTEEMASDEMKKLRKNYTEESIRDAQMSIREGTKSDLLKCAKCKKRNCTYNQMQTRSADEPMTTFVLCNECGHRWKFC